MSSGDTLGLLANGVVFLFVVVIVLAGVVVLHHFVTERQRRLNRLRFESAALTLAPHLVATNKNLDRAVAAVRLQTGDRAVALVLRKMRYVLKGEIAENASAVLDEIGEVQRLLYEAKSRREWRRLAAVRGLGECGSARARKALIAASSSDGSEDVRNVAREGLLNDGTPQALDAAIESFIAAIPAREGARRSFYTRLAFGSEQQMAALIRSGRLPSAEQKLALEALGDVGRRSAVSLAMEHLMSPDAELRATAIRVIGKVGGENEIRHAVHALDDQEWFVRAAAARSLGWLFAMQAGSAAPVREAAQQRLDQHLADPDWWVRANSARALSRSGAHGVELLRQTAAGGDANAREAADAALVIVDFKTKAAAADQSGGQTLDDLDPELTMVGERTFRPGGRRA